MKLKLKDILAKDVANLSDEEKAFLREQSESLNDEQKEKFAEVLSEETALNVEDVKSLIAEPIKAFEAKIEKMADDIVAKFKQGVEAGRSKAIDNAANDVEDADSTREFMKALLSGNKAETKRVSAEAWKKALTSKDKTMRERAKAMSTATSGESPDDAQAGLLIPPELMTEVLRIKQTQFGLARRDMRYLPFSGPGNSRTIPALGTSVAVYWTDEGGKKKATQPNFNLVTQTLKKLAAIVPMTEEILEDSAINLTSLLGELFAEATNKEEDIQFFNGTGSPWTGILQNGSVPYVTQASGDVNQLTADDLLDMVDKTPTGALAGSKFYFHRTIESVLRKLKDNEGRYILQMPQDNKPGTLWGYAYETSDAFPSLTEVTTGTAYVLFGNLKMAAILGDKQQLRVKLLDQATITDTDDETVLNLAEQDMVALRVVERVGYVLAMPAAVTVLKANITQS